MWSINPCAPMVASDSSFELNRLLQLSLLLLQCCFVGIFLLRRRISDESNSECKQTGVEGEQTARLSHLGIGVAMSMMYCPYVVQSGVVALYVVSSACQRISCDRLKNWFMAVGKVALVVLFTSAVMEISMTRFDQATGHCFQQDYLSFL